MRTTRNPIPDSIQPIVTIGSVLPPFALIILTFLWFKLNSNTEVIVPYLGYCSVTLLPLLLNWFARWKHGGTTLPAGGRFSAGVFWLIALAPVTLLMASLSNVDLQLALALALPSVLISGFYCSALAYLVTALVLAQFRKTKEPESQP
jgi:hypothetical protein